MNTHSAKGLEMRKLIKLLFSSNFPLGIINHCTDDAKSAFLLKVMSDENQYFLAQ
jgi:hypothetical protein